jgi:hypothetical protein
MLLLRFALQLQLLLYALVENLLGLGFCVLLTRAGS